jgi:phage shock protein E
MELSKSQVTWKWTKRILPVVLGATAGFLYYNFVGCVTGTCAITSNPWLSTGYGALIGAVFTSWKPNTKK